MLVPEQASTEAEKQIVRLHPDHATDNIEVLSFNRLAYRIFEELGIKNPEVIDDITKAMILRRVAADHKKELKIWSRSFERTGFVDNLKSMISELYQYGITPEQLRRACERDAGDISGDAEDEGGERAGEGAGGADAIRGALGYKLHDLSVIYEAFSGFIRDRYITLEEIPDVLARNIHKSAVIRDSVIVLDGFTGFTPIQYRIIENLLAYAREVVFTVTWGEGDSLFRMSREMHTRICELAEKNQVMHGADSYMGATGICAADGDGHTSGKAAVNPDIAYLEQHFLRFDDTDADSKKGRIGHDGIRIIKASTMVQEVEAVVCDIERLVKLEGERYRHIAIICGNISDYQEILSRTLTKSGMPYYMDHKLETKDNPLTAMIAGALGCVSEDYSYDQIMTYLRTGLVTDDRYMTDVLDNYMYVTGRRGYKRMSQEWTYLPREVSGVGLDDINHFREEIMTDIEPLRTIYSGGTACVKDAIQCIRELLIRHETQRKLSEMADAFARRGDAAKAREYAKVYEETDRVLTRVAELIGDDSMKCRDLAAVLRAGIDQIRVGMIPSSADTIVVGDITRTRLDDIRYLYVLGVNEGVIPQQSGTSGTITDREKEILGAHGIALSPTAREDVYIQRYYLYLLFTKPSVRLILSCAGMDGAGKAMRESYILEHIRSLYENIPVEDAEKYIAAYDAAKAMNIAADLLRERPEDNRDALTAYLRSRPEAEPGLRRLISAAEYRYEAGGIEPETAQALYKDGVTGSVTRFENYARCPFMQFVKYGLEIDPLEKYSIQPADIGTLVHSALEKIFTAAQSKELDLTTADATQLDSMTENAVMEACMGDETGRYTDTSKSQYIADRLKKEVRLNLDILVEQLKADGFSPRYLELSFNRDGVRGKIDRVDTKQLEDGSTAVRIIDYKTGTAKWDVGEAVQGRNTQLPIYMDAALETLRLEERSGQQIAEAVAESNSESGSGRCRSTEGDEAENPRFIPAGMLYYHVDEPILEWKDIRENGIKDELYKELTPEGLLNQDIEMPGAKASGSPVATASIESLLSFVRKRYADTRSEILEGAAAVTPFRRDDRNNACAYCGYRAICGFDKKLPGYAYRSPLKIKDEQAWKMVLGEKTEESEEDGQASTTADESDAFKPEPAADEQANEPGERRKGEQ